ncbi:restriction endonuclease subunit S [Veillonella seminalis]|uniref:restriction endonuclease subunit S n=1 Tax=Veillonella seminalis TaxID=1502943 RepID=UPI0023F81B02|nr:restriction endonuclease subunit S [Veillonella seminalis]
MEKRKTPRIRFKGFSDDWEQRKLGACFEERCENMPDGELISVTISDGIKKFSELGRHDNSNQDKSKYKKVCIGDIAYNSMRMWQGASGYSPFEGIVSPAYTVLKPNVNINSKCVSYLFKRQDMIHVFQLNSQGITSDNWNLKFPALSQIAVSLPGDIKEQSRIATYFSNIDTLITLHQRKLEKLKIIKKSMLEKCFPKKGEKVPKIRFSGFTDDWKQRKLGDVANSFEYGLNVAAKAYDGINKYIRITDIDDVSRKFLFNNLTSPNVNISEAINYQLKKGDILFARTGASVGKTYLYSEKDGMVFYAGFLIRAKISSSYDSNFIFQNTLTENYRRYIQITSQRSGQPGVNAQEYGEYKLMIPRLLEQKKIGNYFKYLDTLITLHQSKLEKLQKIKKSMLERMFV